MNKLLFGISLAKKSGKLIYGFDKVVESAKKGEAKLVIVASDISEKTTQRVKHQVEDKTTVHISALTQSDLSQVCGRMTGVLAITDVNLAILCQNAISQTEGE